MSRYIAKRVALNTMKECKQPGCGCFTQKGYYIQYQNGNVDSMLFVCESCYDEKFREKCYAGDFDEEKGMPDDTACDVKRILVGNQIILNLMMSNTQMQRFGIMETMRATDLELAGSSCMIRTAATVKIDNTSVLAYEVLRDTPDSYEKLMSKLERYYNLIHNETYLDSNYHGDASYPQMIICGESRNHNIKIAEYLRANGMWSEENTILFTEDLLNMKRSLVSIYALADDNTQNWYALPERKESFREAA